MLNLYHIAEALISWSIRMLHVR